MIRLHNPAAKPKDGFGDYRDRRKRKAEWVQVSRVPREQYRTIKPLVGEKDCG